MAEAVIDFYFLSKSAVHGTMTCFIKNSSSQVKLTRIGSRVVRGGGGRNMKYQGPQMAAIFLVTVCNHRELRIDKRQRYQSC